jgi:hypothetical protein
MQNCTFEWLLKYLKQRFQKENLKKTKKTLLNFNLMGKKDPRSWWISNGRHKKGKKKEETKEDACQKFQSLGRPTAKQLNGNDMER